MNAGKGDGPVLPRFYLRHGLPGGTVRCAYHRTLIDGTDRYTRGNGSDWSWTATGGVPESEVPVDWSGDWLVTTAPVATLTRTRRGDRRRDGWTKRDTPEYSGPVPGDIGQLHVDLPERPDPATVAHHVVHDAAHACWQCRQFVAHYEPKWTPGPDVTEHQDLTGFAPLPGQLPPTVDISAWRFPPTETPGRRLFSDGKVDAVTPQWVVDDPSALAVFGQGAAHLLRGRLTGFRSAVGTVLANDPRVGSFYDFHGSRDYQGFSVTVRVPWETHRIRIERVKPTSRSRKTQPVQRDVWAIEQRLDIAVPEALPAPNLADAVATWDEAVAREVARFFPYGDVAACDHCEGRGWVARPGGGA